MLIFINIIKEFLFSKVGRYILLATGILFGLYFIHNNIYQKGFKDGKQEQINEYNLKIEKIIAEQKELQKKAVEDAVEIAKKEKEIKIVYKDKIKEVEKIVNKIEYKECKLSDEDFEKVKKSLEEIK